MIRPNMPIGQMAVPTLLTWSGLKPVEGASTFPCWVIVNGPDVFAKLYCVEIGYSKLGRDNRKIPQPLPSHYFLSLFETTLTFTTHTHSPMLQPGPALESYLSSHLPVNIKFLKKPHSCLPWCSHSRELWERVASSGQ